jgi:hypothetical protein
VGEKPRFAVVDSGENKLLELAASNVHLFSYIILKSLTI